MLALRSAAVRNVCRAAYSSTTTTAAGAAKPPSLAKVVARLRRDTQAPMSRARIAAEKHPNDYDAALKWLSEEMARVGREKAGKLADRVTAEGLVAAMAGPGARGVLVEMVCETDFVAKNEMFRALTRRTAVTAMLAGDFTSAAAPAVSSAGLATLIPEEQLLAAPLLELPEKAAAMDPTAAVSTVQEGIMDAISKMGEKVALRRAIMLDGEVDKSAAAAHRVVASYTHGGAEAGVGRLAGLVLLEAVPQPDTAALTAASETALTQLARDLARQVVGFSPTSIDVPANLATPEEREAAAATALLRQPSLRGDSSVAETLDKFAQQHQLSSVRVVDFVRHEVGGSDAVSA